MQGFFMMEDLERGPRYEAYAALRERKLRMKYLRQQQEEETEEAAKVLTPPRKKQVKFQSGRKGSSLVAQSVPDFSAALRKENRKPVSNNMLPPLMESTPPSKKSGVLWSGSGSGSKSANASEKKRGGQVLMPRKSYAGIYQLNADSSRPRVVHHKNYCFGV